MVDTTAQPTSLDRRRVLRRRIGVLLVAIAGIVATAWRVVRDPYSCEFSIYGSNAGIPHLSLVPFGPRCTEMSSPPGFAPNADHPGPVVDRPLAKLLHRVGSNRNATRHDPRDRRRRRDRCE